MKAALFAGRRLRKKKRRLASSRPEATSAQAVVRLVHISTKIFCMPALLTGGAFEDIRFGKGLPKSPDAEKILIINEKESSMKKCIMATAAALVLLSFPCFAPAAQEEASVPAVKSVPAEETARETVGRKVHGNPGSKIYHMPSCRYYNSKGASKVFSTVEEAKAAGYRPCKSCSGKGGHK